MRMQSFALSIWIFWSTWWITPCALLLPQSIPIDCDCMKLAQLRVSSLI